MRGCVVRPGEKLPQQKCISTRSVPCHYIRRNTMPKNPNVNRVMVIGAGPIVIGQAAEFDYAGTQACR